MSKGDVFRIFDFVGKLVKNDRKKSPQPINRSRNLITAPATCYPLIIHRKVVKKAMAGTY